ncbi:MAG: tRNA preQ1(34) S-adenosylmethionine ribosyltransferase-isomerase QueA [Gammaproteobacteria bacterium]|nr:tRNA preQ1(34) S-adenosylmethionine ribosyltransferase-isomerase QueA [Gammaproteobacteria bacterium]MCY4228257.1 tRNA preQ1(34) S-adenosylmethionine ribosyltransferase-isomerase QueA [Gammaproteobacteria bacterium]
MNLNDFDYALPEDQIAQYPKSKRSESRLLRVKLGSGELQDMQFDQLASLLSPGDRLVVNDTRVLPARMMARKPTGGKVEIMLERMLDDSKALVQLKASKPIQVDQMLIVEGFILQVRERQDNFHVVHANGHCNISRLFEKYGQTPLPPYVGRAVEAQDENRYQTVYAEHPGAVAAPTAGLHFDRKMIELITSMGVGWSSITLHVGAGTFQPIRKEDILQHRMHREWLDVNAGTCREIIQTKKSGSKVIAVGTTVVRALETAVHNGNLEPFSGDTQLYITPGYRFRVVDSLITNFHLPRSSLLVLVSAFAGREHVLSAYRHAVAHGYRFYSYGDAMFLEKQP